MRSLSVLFAPFIGLSACSNEVPVPVADEMAGIPDAAAMQVQINRFFDELRTAGWRTIPTRQSLQVISPVRSRMLSADS
jgi:hypothetical protein